MPSFLVPKVQPDVLPDSKSHSRQVLQVNAAPIGHTQPPALQVLFPGHLFPQLPQFALSVCLLVQLPQFVYPEGQQRPAPVLALIEQFPFWQVLLVWHEPPSAVFATQLPLPSQTRFDPHAVPTVAFD